MKDDNKDEKKKPDDDGLAERDKRYVKVRRSGGSPRAAVRAYCAGNRWLTENAKGVGNW
jgi:hypothetical protein